MEKYESFHRKHPAGSNDYQLAYELIHSLKEGENRLAEPKNLAAFRKYVCDLAMKNNKVITTRKVNGFLKVIRLE